MKIKSIEDFTLEECEEYLRFYPDGQDRAAVEDRLKELKENKSKHKPEAIDTKWIDKRQFKDDNEKCFKPNPFKEKSLEDFTIADCESYINSYPYGEHILEVKAHIRKLKSAPPKKVDNKKKEKKSEPAQVVQKKPQEKKHVNKRNTYKKQKTEPIVSYDKQTIQYKAERNETVTRNNDDKDIIKSVILIIVTIVAIIIAIVLYINDIVAAILPILAIVYFFLKKCDIL